MKGTVMRSSFLPYFIPSISDEEIRSVTETLSSNWLTTGPKVHEFEQAFARTVGARHAIAVNSCTAALHLGLVLSGIKPGDEVITTPLTFCATVNVIIHTGAVPVLADIDPITGCLSPHAVRSVITEKTKAIIPVHFAGTPYDIDTLHALAHDHALAVIDDAAHALPTYYKNRIIGSFGNPTAFSFYVTKNITTGEGGMLVVNDDNAAHYARILTLHGISADAWKRYHQAGSWRYDVECAGFKYNMMDIQAALGLQQLRKLDSFQQRRSAIAARYTSALASLPLILPVEIPETKTSWHLYVIRLKPDAPLSRNTLIDALKKRNIGTGVHFIPLHHHSFYQNSFGWKIGDFPNCDSFYSAALSLPLYPAMTDDDVQDVIDALYDIIV